MNEDKTIRIIPPKRIEIAAMTAFSMLALFLAIETLSVYGSLGRPGVPATDTITVTGQGQATLAPDVARVSFSVENTSATVAAAQTATTKQANAAIDFVKKQGVADKDVKTLSYNISPQYSYDPCPLGSYCPSRSPRVTGYQVSETVQVTLRDLTKVGDLLAGLGKLEVQNLNGPAFALDDSNAGYDAARADAIEKAKTQADLLAKQLGVHLGKIVNFSESSGNYPYPMMYGLGGGMSEKASAPTPDVPVGENTYNASVTITYSIR